MTDEERANERTKQQPTDWLTNACKSVLHGPDGELHELDGVTEDGLPGILTEEEKPQTLYAAYQCGFAQAEYIYAEWVRGQLDWIVAMNTKHGERQCDVGPGSTACWRRQAGHVEEAMECHHG